MKINDRLKKIGDLVAANSFCLDVGCDHAFLDIYLVKLNKNIKAIASDVIEGPLVQARKNIKREGLTDKIIVKQGDGLDTYEDGVDTVIISGMGGRNMIGIFKNNLNILKKLDTIIISPNNYQEDVKRFLCKNGFYIDDEIFVKEKKFIYQIIKFKKGHRHYSRLEYFIGPKFLEKKEDLFFEYYDKELKSREIILQILPKNCFSRRFKVKQEIKMINKAIKNDIK